MFACSTAVFGQGNALETTWVEFDHFGDATAIASAQTNTDPDDHDTDQDIALQPTFFPPTGDPWNHRLVWEAETRLCLQSNSNGNVGSGRHSAAKSGRNFAQTNGSRAFLLSFSKNYVETGLANPNNFGLAHSQAGADAYYHIPHNIPALRVGYQLAGQGGNTSHNNQYVINLGQGTVFENGRPVAAIVHHQGLWYYHRYHGPQPGVVGQPLGNLATGPQYMSWGAASQDEEIQLSVSTGLGSQSFDTVNSTSTDIVVSNVWLEE